MTLKTGGIIKFSGRFHNHELYSADARLSSAAIGKDFQAIVFSATKVPTLTPLPVQECLDFAAALLRLEGAALSVFAQGKRTQRALKDMVEKVKELDVQDAMRQSGRWESPMRRSQFRW